MKKQNLLITLGAAAVALAVAVPAAMSHGPRGGDDGERRGGPPIAHLKEKLGLNDQQVAKLEALKDDQGDDAQSLREQIRTKRDELHALLLAPTLDKAKLSAASREINALEGQLQDRRLEFLIAARGVLTPEQFKTFVDMKKGGRHHGHRFERGGPDRDDRPERGDDAGGDVER